MVGRDKFKEDRAHEYDVGARNTVMEKIKYNHNLSLIQTLPTSSTWYPPQPHTNDQQPTQDAQDTTYITWQQYSTQGSH